LRTSPARRILQNSAPSQTLTVEKSSARPLKQQNPNQLLRIRKLPMTRKKKKYRRSKSNLKRRMKLKSASKYSKSSFLFVKRSS